MNGWLRKRSYVPTRLLDAYLDGDLPPAEQAALARALADSAELRSRLDGLWRVRQALAAAPPLPELTGADAVSGYRRVLARREVARRETKVNPLRWVGSSSFAGGLLYVVSGSVANILFKNMGMSNGQAALWSSLAGVPYVLKVLLAPLVGAYRLTRRIVVTTQLLAATSIGGAALLLSLPGGSWVVPVLALLAAAAILGAVQDIAADTIYETALTADARRRYVVMQSVAWSLGPVLANGALLYTTGEIHDSAGSYAAGWTAVMLITAALLLMVALYHAWALPQGTNDGKAPWTAAQAIVDLRRSVVSLFRRKTIFAMLAFVFFFRFGNGLAEKVGVLFLIDGQVSGGLGLTNQALAIMSGVVGTVALMAGSVLGSGIIALRGLKWTLVVMSVAMNLANAIPLIMSRCHPTSVIVIGGLVALQKLVWGAGLVGHVLYMAREMLHDSPDWRAQHYMMATALAGACMLLTGAVSGYVQQAVGYSWFFVIVLIGGVPSVVATLLAQRAARR